MKTSANILAYLLGALALLFVGGLIRDHYRDRPPGGGHQEPVVAAPAKEIVKLPVREIVRVVRVPVLPPKAEQEIGERFRLDLHVDQLLTKVDLPKAPHGGEAVVTAGPQGDIDVTIIPKPRPFFDLGGQLEVGGGPTFSSTGELGGKVFVAKDLLRLGEMTLKAEASVAARGGQGDAAVGLFAVYRR